MAGFKAVKRPVVRLLLAGALSVATLLGVAGVANADSWEFNLSGYGATANDAGSSLYQQARDSCASNGFAGYAITWTSQPYWDGNEYEDDAQLYCYS